MKRKMGCTVCLLLLAGGGFLLSHVVQDARFRAQRLRDL